jgi:hypothetical protein
LICASFDPNSGAIAKVFAVTMLTIHSSIRGITISSIKFVAEWYETLRLVMGSETPCEQTKLRGKSRVGWTTVEDHDPDGGNVYTMRLPSTHAWRTGEDAIFDLIGFMSKSPFIVFHQGIASRTKPFLHFDATIIRTSHGKRNKSDVRSPFWQASCRLKQKEEQFYLNMLLDPATS